MLSTLTLILFLLWRRAVPSYGDRPTSACSPHGRMRYNYVYEYQLDIISPCGGGVFAVSSARADRTGSKPRTPRCAPRAENTARSWPFAVGRGITSSKQTSQQKGTEKNYCEQISQQGGTEKKYYEQISQQRGKYVKRKNFAARRDGGGQQGEQ